MSNIIQEEIKKIREMMLLENLVQEGGAKKLKQTLDILKKKKKVLLLSCSNRHNWDPKKIDTPKSKLIAMYLNAKLKGLIKSREFKHQSQYHLEIK